MRRARGECIAERAHNRAGGPERTSTSEFDAARAELKGIVAKRLTKAKVEGKIHGVGPNFGPTLDL